MKRWKRSPWSCSVLVILSQFPFVYRRYRLGRLSATINQLNLTRVATASPGEFVEYKGVMHVHSFLGATAAAASQKIIAAAAKANQLNFR